eukprot:maker-scaffold43_size480169-snap-gene-2.23 protein:Tk12728 transcript:maker-scaffold43_size480169-snap-gene-2.23-mRNA-1 annotation:"serine threonine-protein kinase doa"
MDLTSLQYQRQSSLNGRVLSSSNHHSKPSGQFSGLYGNPPTSMVKRTRNDEEFYGGFRRSSSLRRSHRENICPHHGHQALVHSASSSAMSSLLGTNAHSNNKIPLPGRAERTTSNSTSATPGLKTSASLVQVPGYQQGTVASVRRSRDRTNGSPGSNQIRRSHSTVSRNASFRSRSSAQKPSVSKLPSTTAASDFEKAQLRYENEVGSNSRPSYYHLSAPTSRKFNTQMSVPSHNEPRQFASSTLSRLQRNSSHNVLSSSQNANNSNYHSNNHHNSSSSNNNYILKNSNHNHNDNLNHTDSLLRTLSFRGKPSDIDLFSSLPCLNDDEGSEGADSGLSLHMFDRKTSKRNHHSGGSASQSSSTSSNGGGSSGSSTTSTGTTVAHNRSMRSINHLPQTPNSSSLVLNSLAYQLLPSPGKSGPKEHTRDESTPIARPSGAGFYKHYTNKSLSSTALSHGLVGSLPSMALVGSLQPAIPQPSPSPLRKKPVADDVDGHLAYLVGDVIGERYEIVSNLGEGTFGKVAKVRDLETHNYFALKIIKNIHKYREAAKLEINVLKKLNAKEDESKFLCVRMFDSFNFFGHMCLTFEVLGESVFDFLKSNAYAPYPMEQVRNISQQLCQAVAFMHDHKVTHTDLKPENVLFVTNDWYSENVPNVKKPVRRMRDTRVKLIDFGSATFEWEHHSSVVSTRHYRAPEVILELGWSHPCDVWSIGCIIFELHQGHTLFQTHDNREHLAMMAKILDRAIPHHMAKRSKTKYFNSQHKLNWDTSTAVADYTNQHCKPLHKYQKYPSSSTIGQEEVTMYDLVIRMLDYDPTFRMTLKEALRHPFFDKLGSLHRQSLHGSLTRSSSYHQPTSSMANLSRHILRLQI